MFLKPGGVTQYLVLVEDEVAEEEVDEVLDLFHMEQRGDDEASNTSGKDDASNDDDDDDDSGSDDDSSGSKGKKKSKDHTE